MIDMFLEMLKAFWVLLKYPIYAAVSVFVVFYVLFLLHVLYLRVFKKMKKPDGVHVRIKEPNLFKKLFILAPKQCAKDYMERNPEWFKYQGVIIYTGRQGRGKTVSLVRDTMLMQREYPKAKCISNLGYTKADEVLGDWRQLIDYKNGIQGVIVQMDETQNWFSSNQSKDFPPQMLEVITQNRKNRRIVLGTAQSFNRLAKPLREQTTEIRECHTFAGCFTVVIRKEPFLTTMGDVDKLKFRGMYCFVHNDEIRKAYDTYKVIESLRESGFAPQTGDVDVNVTPIFDKKALKKLR